MILITGASGFLGGHLLEALQDQPLPVRALYHSHVPATRYASVTWQQCNLLDIYDVAAAMKGITHIYHCAGIVSFDPRRKHAVIQENTTMTAHVVNAALDQQVERMIHISSVAALGRGIPSGADGMLHLDEDMEYEEHIQNSSYAQGKFRAEMEVWRGMAEGLSAAILNPSVILGEGNWEEGSANLMKIVYSEFPWYTTGINGWVDVKDLVRAMLLLMQSPVNEERFIINNGNYAYLDIFTKMAKALNRKPPHQKAGSFITEIVWRMEYLKSMVAGKAITISKETARTAQLKCEYDNKKFLKLFPDFQYTPIDHTIQRMAAAFLKDRKH